MDCTAVGGFLRTVCHWVVNLLAPADMIRVCGSTGVRIRFFHAMVRC